VLSVFTYSYDAAGNRTEVQEANADRVTWSYDDAGQLTRERRSGANAYDITYTYDEVGNRLTKVDSDATTTYSYDRANQLTAEERPAARLTYSYDANGNLELVENDEALTTYSWDIENRMVGAELPDATLNTMSYDGDGRRRTLEDSDGSRDIVWDGENVLRELDGENVIAYTHNPQQYGELISQRRSGATAFHHYDALGSTDRLTDTNEGVSASYLYKAFGEQSVLSGSHANPFTWVGRLGYYRQGDLATWRGGMGRDVSTGPTRRNRRSGPSRWSRRSRRRKSRSLATAVARSMGSGWPVGCGLRGRRTRRRTDTAIDGCVSARTRSIGTARCPLAGGRRRRAGRRRATSSSRTCGRATAGARVRRAAWAP